MPSFEVKAYPTFLEYARSTLRPEEEALYPPERHHVLNSHKTCFSISEKTRSNFCVADEVPLSRALEILLTHQSQPDKDANLCIPGEVRLQRLDRCVKRIYWLAYDVDGGLNLEELRKLCERFSFLLVVYTTHSHLADGVTEKYRVVIILAEPIPLDEVEQEGYRAIYMAVGKLLFGDARFDPCCKNPARGFFLPAYPPERADKFHSFLVWGPLFEWRETWETLKAQLERNRIARQKRVEELQAMRLTQSADEVIRQISECLKHIPADDYETWFKVLCAIMHESNCSAEGRQLAHDWSETVPEKYNFGDTERLLDEIENKDHPEPATMGTLVWLARENVPGFTLRRPSPSLYDFDPALLGLN